MNRRGFLKSIIAVAAAPAIVRSESIMRVIARDPGVFLPGGLWIPSGFASARYANCVVTDDMLVRFDTTNGIDQFYVDARIPSEVWEREGFDAATSRILAPAMAVLCDHVRHKHGGISGFKAPPINLERSPFFKGEIVQ